MIVALISATTDGVFVLRPSGGTVEAVRCWPQSLAAGAIVRRASAAESNDKDRIDNRALGRFISAKFTDSLSIEHFILSGGIAMARG